MACLPAVDAERRPDRMLEIARLAHGGDRVLEIAGLAQQDLPRRANRWMEEHKLVMRKRAKTLKKAPVRALHEQAAITQRTLHNREIASKADFTFDPDAKSTAHLFRGVQKGKWKQRTPDEGARIIFANPATPMRTLGESIRPRAGTRHCTDWVCAGRAPRAPNWFY